VRYYLRVWLLYVLIGAALLPGTTQAQQVEGESAYTIHVVQRGENLFRIALGYGMTTDELAAINGISNPADIQVGQRLLIPNAGSSAEPAYAPIDNSANTALSDKHVIHTVQPGETLFTIANSYGVTVNDASSVNNLDDPTRIFAGQQLIIPNASPPQLAADLPEGVTSFSANPVIFTEGKTGKLSLSTSAAADLTGTFLERELVVISDETRTQHFALVGIPVFTEAGPYPLSLNVQLDSGAANTLNVNIQVVRGGYGSEIINLLDGRDNLLNENVEEAEMTLLRNVTAPFTPELYMESSMGLPAAAAVTSQFGTLRSYNGGAFNRYHNGTDFAGAPGTPILAPAAGQVVMADTLNVRGNATMIDHGWGIYTGYWHQTEIYVQPGDFVQTGQIIGTIGATGRVTGAHLHWELWVNGVTVDPMQWVQQSLL
jgi:murein DD-endopeptidase MepM/ murein hydrolase activator NlpD